MITWVNVRIPVEIKPGDHTPHFATCPLIKGLLAALPEGSNAIQQHAMIKEAVEAMGRAAVEGSIPVVEPQKGSNAADDTAADRYGGLPKLGG